MTEIKRSIPIHNPQQTKSEPNRDQFSNSARDNTAKHNQRFVADGQGRGEKHRSTSSLLFSQSAFEDKLQPTGYERNSDHEQSESDGRENEHILLASLDAARTVPAERSNSVVAPMSSGLAERVEEIAKQVAAKLDVALRPGPLPPANPLTLQLVLDPGKTGLSGVKVSMADGVLSVVLVPGAQGGQAVDQDISQAALGLAQILQARFPNKPVRVLQESSGEETGHKETATGERIDSVSGLFQNLPDRK